MRRKKNVLWLAPVSILSFLTLAYLIDKTSPTENFYNIPTIPSFFVLLFIFLFSFFSILLENSRRAFLISSFVEIFLILRLVNLTHPFFAVLLIVIFIALELVLKPKPDKIHKL